jgi:hypothetical protein
VSRLALSGHTWRVITALLAAALLIVLRLVLR